ncbi:unnamed protein product, partial [Linum tenue]
STLSSLFTLPLSFWFFTFPRQSKAQSHSPQGEDTTRECQSSTCLI